MATRRMRTDMGTDHSGKYALGIFLAIVSIGIISQCNAEPVPGYPEDCIVEYWQTGPSCV
jgi:hypothetical protein